MFFFFNYTATPTISPYWHTRSPHDVLPICNRQYIRHCLRYPYQTRRPTLLGEILKRQKTSAGGADAGKIISHQQQVGVCTLHGDVVTGEQANSDGDRKRTRLNSSH